MPKISDAKGTIFDGGQSSLRTAARSSRSRPSSSCTATCAEDIDPITYEVVRHNLWNVNEEHGATIQRLSGSPVAMYALDLNPSILTEDGEFVYFGPYMQYMSGVTDTQVKWILEYRSDNPGIRDGDMFLANDPWVGAAHQQDVMLICPVFWKGELFCWVTNCLHQYDIGGITPASASARRGRDAFDEGILHPAGEDRRGQRDPPRHRGALPALLAQARSWSRSIFAPRWPATSPRATACSQLIRRYGAGRGQGRDEAHHRQRRGRVSRQSSSACPTASGATAPMSNAAGRATAAPIASC